MGLHCIEQVQSRGSSLPAGHDTYACRCDRWQPHNRELRRVRILDQLCCGSSHYQVVVLDGGINIRLACSADCRWYSVRLSRGRIPVCASSLQRAIEVAHICRHKYLTHPQSSLLTGVCGGVVGVEVYNRHLRLALVQHDLHRWCRQHNACWLTL